MEYEQYKPLTSMNTSVLRKDLYYRCVSCEPVISLDTTCIFIVFNCCRINTTFSRRCWRCTTSTSPLSSTHASTATSLPSPLASPSISTSSHSPPPPSPIPRSTSPPSASISPPSRHSTPSSTSQRRAPQQVGRAMPQSFSRECRHRVHGEAPSLRRLQQPAATRRADAPDAHAVMVRCGRPSELHHASHAAGAGGGLQRHSSSHHPNAGAQ